MDSQQQAPSSGNRKLLYIVGGLIILAIAGWLLARGAGLMGGVAIYDAATSGGMERGADGSTTYSSDEGSVTAGGSYPENWPSDAPKYDGGDIQYSGTSNPQTGKEGSAVVFTARASASAVLDFYKGELPAKGWTVASTANVAGATVLAATKGTMTFGLYIVDAGNGQVSVTAGVGMQ